MVGCLRKTLKILDFNFITYKYQNFYENYYLKLNYNYLIFIYIVSPRPHPIAEVAKHVVVAHQSGYQDVLAIVLAHLPNTHTGQDHSI